MDIQKFLTQEEELEGFITGPAGSGKTTSLQKIIKELDKLKVAYQVVAYTHKAKDILIDKLPENTPISTLHSWLKKRPGINEEAKHRRVLMISRQYSKPAHLELLIVDEFSFVGEKDYFSIGELQDEFQLKEAVTTYKCDSCSSTNNDGCICFDCADEGIDSELIAIVGDIPKPLKVLYIGDLNQLSPVDGTSAITPTGNYWTKLTTNYRQNSESTLIEPLAKLVAMIEGTIPMAYIHETADFNRKQPIDDLYKVLDTSSKIMLAYTNKAVQEHNAVIQGYDFPKANDLVYNSSLKEEMIWQYTLNLSDDLTLITPTGNITKDTKYNPFKELQKHKVITYVQTDIGIVPTIFGVYNNKILRQKLGDALITANKSNTSDNAKKNAYKAYKCINDYVSVVDFPHCQTIHKSQGQEFDYVFIDSKNLLTCKNKLEMMKLLYVGCSRAKLKIFLNN